MFQAVRFAFTASRHKSGQSLPAVGVFSARLQVAGFPLHFCSCPSVDSLFLGRRCVLLHLYSGESCYASVGEGSSSQTFNGWFERAGHWTPSPLHSELQVPSSPCHKSQLRAAPPPRALPAATWLTRLHLRHFIGVLPSPHPPY